MLLVSIEHADITNSRYFSPSFSLRPKIYDLYSDPSEYPYNIFSDLRQICALNLQVWGKVVSSQCVSASGVRQPSPSFSAKYDITLWCYKQHDITIGSGAMALCFVICMYKMVLKLDFLLKKKNALALEKKNQSLHWGSDKRIRSLCPWFVNWTVGFPYPFCNVVID